MAEKNGGFKNLVQRILKPAGKRWKSKSPAKRRFGKFGPSICGTEFERGQLIDAIENYCDSPGASDFEKIEFPENALSQNAKQILDETLGVHDNAEYVALHPGLSKNIQEDVLDWIKRVDARLSNENPFETEAAFVDSLKAKSAAEIAGSLSAIRENYNKISDGNVDFDFYQKQFAEIEKRETENARANLPPDARAKKSESEIEKSKEEKARRQSAVARHLIESMEQRLIDRKNAWQLKLIEEMRQKFVKELLEKLANFKKLEKRLLGIFDETGLLWDLSKGFFKESGFEILKQYADLLEKDESLQELAEILGKYSRAQKEYETELRAKTVVKTEYHPRPAFKGQISGIRLSNDISSVLPSELALFNYPATKKLFELKFAQRQLMSYKYENLVPTKKIETEMEEISKEKEEQKGPIIICVDTSGSMSGTPENVAKTITFALAKIAMREKRKCFLINFSTGIETLDLSFSAGKNGDKNALSRLIVFLRMSFHGGTDASPALNHALAMLKSEDYKNADVLMISDFVMGSLGGDLENKIAEEKQKKTGFYSLVIGASGAQNVIECFNYNWSYNMNDANASRRLVEQLHSMR